MRNTTSLLFTLLTVLSLATVLSGLVFAYIKPSVPEFTVRFEAHPYYVPPVYEIDRYTGENITIQQGYTVKNESIVVTIKNQLFSSYTENGTLVGLTHSVRIKGHFEETWTELVHIEPQDSEYVSISYVYGPEARHEILRYVPVGGQLDFQVDARVGYYTYDPTHCREYFTGETSGWSETKTIIIGEIQTFSPEPTSTPLNIGPTPSPSQEPMLSQEQLDTILILAAIVIVLVAGLGLLVYRIKRK